MSTTIIATVCRDGQEQYRIASKEDTVSDHGKSYAARAQEAASRLRRDVKHAIYWDEESNAADDLRHKRDCAATRDTWARHAETQREIVRELANHPDRFKGWEGRIVSVNLSLLADAAFEDIPSDRFDVSKIYHPDYGKE